MSGATPARSDVDLLGVLLLGLSVLCLLFPIMLSESDGLRRFWWMFVAGAPLVMAFLGWQRRRVDTGRVPLLDVRLLREIPGYSTGAVIGAVYFAGFSGIWLVFALFFQIGEGMSALESGLLVTPFAVGAAVSSTIGGRLVDRLGRWVTVTGLSTVAIGLTAVAVVVPLVPADRIPVAVVVPLLVAGFGGGAVISPNMALTLTGVPTRMAGAASGLIQTGQRIGTAVGTAALAAVFHAAAAGSRFPTGLSVALACAVVLVLVALWLAVRELRATRKTWSRGEDQRS